MNKEERQLHQARLEVAIAILSDKKPLNEPKRKLLRAIVNTDKIVDRILRTYGIFVE